MRVWVLLALLLSIECCLGQSTSEDIPFIKVAEAISASDGQHVTFAAELFSRITNRSSISYDIDNHLTWHNGETLVNVSLTWLAASPDASPWQGHSFVLSSQECSSPDIVSSENRVYDWILRSATSTEMAESGLLISLHQLAPKDGIVDLDLVRCAAVRRTLGLSAIVAAEVLPMPPDFPDSFYAGVEASITNKGYTFYLEEAYDHTCSVVSGRFYSARGESMHFLQDYKNQKVWIMYAPNGTEAFPSGACRSRDMEPGDPFLSFDGNQLAGTAQFLGFVNPERKAEATYVGRGTSGNPTVRGVPVDTWRYNFTNGNRGVNGEYSVDMQFSVPSWLITRGSGHRFLQRITLDGVKAGIDGQGQVIRHTYDYFNFLPLIPDSVAFEPCHIVPNGDGCECLNLNCADRSVVARLDGMTNGAAKTSGLASDGSNRSHRLQIAIACLLTFCGTALVAVAALLLLRRREKRPDRGLPVCEDPYHVRSTEMQTPNGTPRPGGNIFNDGPALTVRGSDVDRPDEQ